jgi:hypothetical protein
MPTDPTTARWELVRVNVVMEELQTGRDVAALRVDHRPRCTTWRAAQPHCPAVRLVDPVQSQTARWPPGMHTSFAPPGPLDSHALVGIVG